MKKLVLLILSAAALGFGARSQSDLQNSGILYVSTGTDTLYINGAFTNTSSGALTNNGRLYVTRDLSNGQSAMPVGTGTLILNGTVLQTASGAQPFRTFNLITANNAGILLNANLNVSGLHTYSTGLISTSATPNYLVYEAGSSYSGANDNSHVNGWVKKFGNSNFTFPVGNNTYMREVTLSNLSSSSEFNCKYNSITPNNTNVLSPIVTVNPNEYWDIPRVSGGTAQVTLNWDNSKVFFPNYLLTNLRATYYNAGLWTDQGGSATGNPLTSGNITSNAMNLFGYFVIGSIDFAVPLQFLNINALRKQGYNQVNWITAQESNVDYFEVERSLDARTFAAIGTVYPSPGSNYRFNDPFGGKGTAYYRIRSAGRDGSSLYSAIATLYADRSGNPSFYVVNNPVIQSSVRVFAGEGFGGTYEYSVTGTLGQLVQRGQIVISDNGTAAIRLDSRLGGIYILELKNREHRFTERIVVQ